ncbi:MAG: hypothetical protein ACI4I5_04750 [Acutalibacteraceae bacterium]
MKKIWKRFLSVALAVCLAMVSLMPCFAEEEVDPLDSVRWGYVYDEAESNALLYFILPADVQMGAEDAAFAIQEEQTQSYTGTMADFATRALAEGKTLATLCLPEQARKVEFCFAEGAFVLADGTPTAAFTESRHSIEKNWEMDTAFPSESLRLLSPKGKALEGAALRFYFSGMEKLPEDLFTLEKVENGTTTLLADRMEITEGEGALVTTAAAGCATYIVRYDGKALYRADLDVLNDREYKSLTAKDRVLSILAGIGLLPLLPVELIVGFVGGFAYGMVCTPMLTCVFVPLLLFAPLIAPIGGVVCGVKGAGALAGAWADTFRRLMAGK